MADQAQRAQVVEIALAAAFGHGNHVIGVTQALSVDSFQAPAREQALAMSTP